MAKPRNTRRISLICRLTDRGKSQTDIAQLVMRDEGLIAPPDRRYIAYYQKKYCK